MSKISAHFEGNGLTVGINYPYSGTLVPSPYYKRDRRVSAVMIEINRKLYMNENTGERNEGFERTKELIRNLLNTLYNGI